MNTAGDAVTDCFPFGCGAEPHVFWCFMLPMLKPIVLQSTKLNYITRIWKGDPNEK